MTARTTAETFLREPAFALLGASRSGRKFGNVVLRELRRKGYRIHPVHPQAASIDGVPSVRSVSALAEPVRAAILVVPPARALAVLDELAAAGIRRVWLQQGAESADVLARADALGLEVIAGECILMFASPTGVHRVHAAVRQVWDRLRTPAA